MSEALADRDRLVGRWLGTLVVVSALAALQALVWPRWPRSPGLPSAQLGRELTRSGLQPRPLPTLPAEPSYERSLSAVLGWQLAGGPELRLAHGSVRQRENFQVAYLGRKRPQLALSARRLHDPQAGSAAGLVQSRPAYQTCVVPGIKPLEGTAVTAEALGKAADLRVSGRIDTIKGVLGLQPTRSFDCILVTLRSDTSQPPAIGIWRDVIAAVSASLQQESRRWP